MPNPSGLGFFFFVRPAGRTLLEVKILSRPDRSNSCYPMAGVPVAGPDPNEGEGKALTRWTARA